MNNGAGVQAVKVLRFTEWFEQWQLLILSGEGQLTTRRVPENRWKYPNCS